MFQSAFRFARQLFVSAVLLLFFLLLFPSFYSASAQAPPLPRCRLAPISQIATGRDVTINLSETYPEPGNSYRLIIRRDSDNQIIFSQAQSTNSTFLGFVVPDGTFSTGSTYTFVVSNELHGFPCLDSPQTVAVIAGASPPPPQPTPPPAAGCSVDPAAQDIGKSIQVYAWNLNTDGDHASKSRTAYLVGPSTIQLENYLDPKDGNWSGKLTVPEWTTAAPVPDGTKYSVEVDDYGVRVRCQPDPIVIYGKSAPIVGYNPCVTDAAGNPTGGCRTGLGLIPPTLNDTVNTVLSIAVGLGGGIALILMVVGAIRVLTSSGDPQKVNAGREIIIGALSGLLFIIFSALILRFIGVSIVGLGQ